MNMLIKRRQLIMAALVVALGAAVFVNWYFTNTGSGLGNETTTGGYVQSIGEAKSVNSDKGDSVSGDSAGGYFDNAKLNRQKSNDEALEKLQDVLKKMPEGASATEVSDKIKELSELIKLESDIETLISAKLGGECVTVISGDKAQVVVEKGKLDENATLQIVDIFTTNTDIPPENIKISEASES